MGARREGRRILKGKLNLFFLEWPLPRRQILGLGAILFPEKQEGVGPADNRPSAEYLHRIKKIPHMWDFTKAGE